MTIRHTFFTGTPCVGKTTALLRIVQSLAANCTGFYTEAVYSQNLKTGLVLRSLDGRSLMIRRAPENSATFSGYDFDCAAFDEFCRHSFRPLQPGGFIVIDELGPMFCRSDRFTKLVEKWLDEGFLIGVIATKGHRLIESIHRRADTEIFNLTAENRDDAVSAVAGRLYKLTEK